MAWLSFDWDYRRKITISGASGAGTNYQVLLKVGESSGATGCDFHLNNNSENFPSGKNQGGDLRFTASDGTTLLDFWVEKVEGTSPNRVAHIWVEVSADLGTNQDIYIYYGNSGATNYSNGDNTFVFFDDFDSFDTNKWTGVGTYSVNNSILKVEGDSDNNYVYSDNTYSFGAVEIRRRGGRTLVQVGVMTGTAHSMYDALGFARRYDDGEYYTHFSDGTKITETGDADFWSGQPVDTWGRSSLRNKGSGYFDFITNDTTVKSDYYASNYADFVNNAEIVFRTGTGATSYYIEVDYIFIRKFVSPEPAFSSVSSLETKFILISTATFDLSNKTLTPKLTKTPVKVTLTLTGKSISNIFRVSIIAGTINLVGKNTILANIVQITKAILNLVEKTITRIGGWIKRDKVSTSWTKRSIPSTSWTKRNE